MEHDGTRAVNHITMGHNKVIVRSAIVTNIQSQSNQFSSCSCRGRKDVNATAIIGHHFQFAINGRNLMITNHNRIRDTAGTMIDIFNIYGEDIKSVAGIDHR